MAKGGHAWQGGACMVCTPPLYEIRPVNARAVCILLECILVTSSCLHNIMNHDNVISIKPFAFAVTVL